MKHSVALVLLACSTTLLFAGCASHQGRHGRSRPPDESGPEDTENISPADFEARQREYNKLRDAAQDRHGMALAKAEEKALELTPGMTEKAVKGLLDLPDETTAETEDAGTAQPWQALLWIYRWNWSAFSSASLEIRFRQEQNSWVVHTWRWVRK